VKVTDILEEHITSIFNVEELYFMLVSCLAYSLILKIEAVFSSKVSVDFQRPTWHYIPKDRTLHEKLCTYFFLETNHRGLSGIPKNPKNCILAGTAAKPSMYLERRQNIA
jgi:hypothetical protein